MYEHLYLNRQSKFLRSKYYLKGEFKLILPPWSSKYNKCVLFLKLISSCVNDRFVLQKYFEDDVNYMTR